jgi:hypothetical protein
MMKNKARAVNQILEMAENRANARQVSGHSASVSCMFLALFGLVVLLMVIAG